MAMPEKERKQLLGLLIGLAAIGPVAFWMYWRTGKVEETQSMRQELDSLQAQIDTARADLREGTVESLKAVVDRYSRALSVMRELVPLEDEVTSLIDSISSQADRRGVKIISIGAPISEVNEKFQIVRYDLVALGPYDEIAEFLSDVASLRRVMVPYNVALGLAPPEQLGGMLVEAGRTYLRVQFTIRTFVKTAEGEFVSDGT